MTKLSMIAHGPFTMAAVVVLLVCCVYARFMYVGWLWKNKDANRKAITARDYLTYLRNCSPVQAKIWIASQVAAVVLLILVLVLMFFR